MTAPRSCSVMSLILFFLILPLSSLSIKIDEKETEKESSIVQTLPNYRVSKPELKKPLQRVPVHLQDIRPGYVDDDAGDVIRIIEPPQHFQQLKRLRQRQPQAPQQAVIVLEQPRKLSSNRSPFHSSQPPKSTSGDLLTQETQNSLQLPMEILASVRKTERLLQRQRQKLPPLVRQRHIQRQTHTLIAQKSLEKQLYQRGQHQRLKAVLSQSQDVDHKRSKRVKREVNKINYDIQKGLKLVAHIGELLKNATVYLPDDSKKSSHFQICGNATNCDNQRRRQRLFKQSKSADFQWRGHGEKQQQKGRNFRNEAPTTTTTIQPTKINANATTTTTAAAAPKSTTSSFTISTTSATPLASRLVNSRKSPNKNRINNTSSGKSQSYLASARRSSSSSSNRSDNVASAVLYADVMTNIRNLWQEHDLHKVEAKVIQPDRIASKPHEQSLDVYLKQLDHLAKKLPSLNCDEIALA